MYVTYGIALWTGKKWICKYTLRELEESEPNEKHAVFLRCRQSEFFVCRNCKLREK